MITDIRDHLIQSVHNFEHLIISLDVLDRVLWVLKEPSKSQESFHTITYSYLVAYAKGRKCLWPTLHDHPLVTLIARIKVTKTCPVVGNYIASWNASMRFDCTETTHEFQGRRADRL